MQFQSRMSRCPIVFEPEQAEEINSIFEGEPPELRELLEGVAGCSPFLGGLMRREADWLRAALAGPVDDVMPGLLGELEDCALADLKPALRIARRRVALYVALADLGGVWQLEEVTGALTDFADRAVQLAARALVERQIARGKLPGQTEADLQDCAGLVVLAMGKMGAHELNYSSDIDLISLFDDNRYDPDDLGEVRSVFVRVTRDLASLLSDLTGDGYVFRTDLRLRPDPSVTPVCLSLSAAEGYYESVGRTWERAAHIKARVCAGDHKAGDAYLHNLSPFIWRKHLDFASIQDAHDMRLRIREHKGLRQKIVLEGHNMKLGPGGIREIEFFTQTRQIIAGGRDPELRERQTVKALGVLAEKEWVPKDIATTLTEDYRHHREVEHRIQMVGDAQTHDLPHNEEGINRIAAMSGMDAGAFRKDLQERLERVRDITEGFFAPGETGGAKPIPDAQREMIERWRSYPALRSARAVEIFERLMPDLLEKLGQAAKPEEAFTQFDNFLARLPAGVQLFSLFEANPQLVDLIVDVAATAPHLAQYLGRNAAVFDAVIGGQFFSDWPGSEAIQSDLEEELNQASDYESRLDAARRWQKEWHFRIGVHQLRGLISADEAGRQYAGLADAVLRAVWPHVLNEFARKHGEAPGRGAVVLGMGSLGSERLTAASDLDLIVIYDAGDAEGSDGPRPLATRPYYARLTQALVTALSAPMAEGRLYEVDMRLRPSGRQGPVATSFASFKSYQREEAWTWEHLALTRARVVVGNPDLSKDTEAFRMEILRMSRDPVRIVEDVNEMRARIASAKPQKGLFEAKLGSGRMQDVELLAQSAALLQGDPSRSILKQIETAQAMGWIGTDAAEALSRSYRLMWQLQSAARLLTGELLELDTIGMGGLAFLLRETGAKDADDLAQLLEQVSTDAAAVIDEALAEPPKN